MNNELVIALCKICEQFSDLEREEVKPLLSATRELITKLAPWQELMGGDVEYIICSDGSRIVYDRDEGDVYASTDWGQRGISTFLFDENWLEPKESN